MNDRSLARPVGGYGQAVARHCIADALGLRVQLGYEIAQGSLEQWLRRGRKPTSLMQIAL